MWKVFSTIKCLCYENIMDNQSVWTLILSKGITPMKTFLHGNDIILLFSHKRFSYGGSKQLNFSHSPKSN